MVITHTRLFNKGAKLYEYLRNTKIASVICFIDIILYQKPILFRGSSKYSKKARLYHNIRLELQGFVC